MSGPHDPHPDRGTDESSRPGHEGDQPGKPSEAAQNVETSKNNVNAHMQDAVREPNAHNNNNQLLPENQNTGINLEHNTYLFRVNRIKRRRRRLRNQEQREEEENDIPNHNINGEETNNNNNNAQDPNRNNTNAQDPNHNNDNAQGPNHNNNNAQDPNHNDNAGDGQAENVVIEVQSGTQVDNNSSHFLRRVWNFLKTKPDIKLFSFLGTVSTGFGTADQLSHIFAHQNLGPEELGTPAWGLGAASGSYLFIRVKVYPKLKEYLRKRQLRRQVAPAQDQNPGSGVRAMATEPFEPKFDYWTMAKEFAAQNPGAAGITHDSITNGIMDKLRAFGMNVPREEVAKIDTEDLFNRVIAWYETTEPEFWSQCRPDVQGNGMDKDNVLAQIAVLHVYKDMCRYSDELQPDNEWIWPKVEEEDSLHHQLVQTYKSAGPGAMYDMMSVYRYVDQSKEEIILPRTTACDMVIDALNEIYFGL